MGGAQFVSMQNHYNLACREEEKELCASSSAKVDGPADREFPAGAARRDCLPARTARNEAAVSPPRSSGP
jgi:hypothetical protein